MNFIQLNNLITINININIRLKWTQNPRMWDFLKNSQKFLNSQGIPEIIKFIA